MPGKVWDGITIPFVILQFGSDEEFHHTSYIGCNYISMLWLKLIYTSKRSPRGLNYIQKPVLKFMLVTNVFLHGLLFTRLENSTGHYLNRCWTGPHSPHGITRAQYVEVFRRFCFVWCCGDITNPLHWRHNDHDSVSNHQPRGCLLNRLIRRRSK